MGRRRKTTPLNPWETELLSGKDIRFIRLGNSLLLSKAFQELTGQEKQTYICMIMECGGNRKFKFTASAMNKYGLSRRTCFLAIEKLVFAGFIKKTYCGRAQMNPNEYEFISDWKRHSSMAGGREA